MEFPICVPFLFPFSSSGFMMFLDDGIPIGQLELTIREYKGSRIGYVNLYYLIPQKRGIGLGKNFIKLEIKI